MLRELATENWAVTISVAPSFSCNKETVQEYDRQNGFLGNG
jgi:hypothetical protein